MYGMYIVSRNMFRSTAMDADSMAFLNGEADEMRPVTLAGRKLSRVVFRMPVILTAYTGRSMEYSEREAIVAESKYEVCTYKGLIDKGSR